MKLFERGSKQEKVENEATHAWEVIWENATPGPAEASSPAASAIHGMVREYEAVLGESFDLKTVKDALGGLSNLAEKLKKAIEEKEADEERQKERHLQGEV